jgi:hypothetical protein
MVVYTAFTDGYEKKGTAYLSQRMIELHGNSAQSARLDLINRWPNGCESIKMYSNGEHTGTMTLCNKGFVFRTCSGYSYIVKPDGRIRRRL